MAKSYLAERKRYARISERRLQDQTPKQAQKLDADLNWAAMDLLKIEANLHVACVNAGLADLREAGHYAEREFNPSAWHRYRWTPNQPERMK
jgi:hypothetical protein